MTNHLAHTAHELKTPITIIRGFAEILLEVPHLEEEKRQEILQRIVQTTERMERLIQNLLLLEEAKNLSPHLQNRCDLRACIENCCQLLLLAYPSVHLHVNMSDAPIWILAHPFLLESVFMNLLENGVKYSSEYPVLHIEMKKVDSWVKVSIRDEGIGIASKDLPHIFDRFYTVDKGLSRKMGGVGLGLFLVKTIVEKQGGRIEVSSELGRGSEFTVFFLFDPCHRIGF